MLEGTHQRLNFKSADRGDPALYSEKVGMIWVQALEALNRALHAHLLAGLLELYLALSDSWRKTGAAWPVERRSQEVLVVWICFCLTWRVSWRTGRWFQRVAWSACKTQQNTKENHLASLRLGFRVGFRGCRWILGSM